MTKTQIEKLKQIESLCDQLFQLTDQLMDDLTQDVYADPSDPDSTWLGFDISDGNDADVYYKIGEIHEAVDGAGAEIAEYIDLHEPMTA